MEAITVTLDDSSFDNAVHAHDALPECANLKISLKRKATVNGKPGVCISWTVRLPSGFTATAQAVTTWENLKAAVRTIEAAL